MPASLTTSTANNATTPFVEVGFASTAYILFCAAIVMLMTPAVGLLYSGLSRSKNSLSIILISCLAYAVVTIQWICFGFSLSFSESGAGFIGTLEYAGFTNVLTQALPLTAAAIPISAFALYQLQFATVTVAIIFGSVAERVRILPSIVFMFIWTTIVYDPVAYWTWGAHGWIRNISCLNTTASGETPCLVGGLDFAGGGPVHMASGAAALAFCIFLGKRKFLGQRELKPHNMINVFIGTALLWFGWFGFNGGSALGATSRAAMATVVTTVAASSGGLVWTLMDFMHTKKFSGVAFCSGVLAGLVGITPAAGFVTPWASIVIGGVAAACCNLAIRIKEVIGYDDALDAFGLHAVGGFAGSILTGLFASKDVALLDGTAIAGGAFINGEWILVGYQLAGSVSILVYSFIVTYILLLLINMIPGMKFRVSDHEESVGLDFSQMGESGYDIVPCVDDKYSNMKTTIEITDGLNTSNATIDDRVAYTVLPTHTVPEKA
ncbi:ammonium transporter AmtB-like domain-containing protein [Globomyces pollinis-pini]|nr:ammonium transporter AmtB-like domain-containing protein [Globomyces pollinis-pini]